MYLGFSKDNSDLLSILISLVRRLSCEKVIYMLWFQTKPEEFGYQVRVGNQQFCPFTMGFITLKSFKSVLKFQD